MPFAAAGAAAAGAATSGLFGILGSKKASSAAAQGAAQAQQLEQQVQDQAKTYLAPYNTAGQTSLTQQQNLLGLNGQDAANAAMQTYQQSPGYQFTLQQGLRAVDAGAAASGLLRSGAALKAEQTFGQGLANQDFQQYYNNLMGISTLGENAGVSATNAMANVANNAANLAQGAGNTQASIYGNMYSGLGSTVNSLFSNPAVQNWMSGGGSGTGYVDQGTMQI